MTDRVFIDTNILVYAHDLDAKEKQAIAAKLVTDLWKAHTGVLSTQVLQEFYVTLTRKIPKPLKLINARKILRNYFSWDIVINDIPIIRQASEIEETYKLSFWDALIISAAYSKNCESLFTEDLQHGQAIEGIRILNPFKM